MHKLNTQFYMVEMLKRVTWSRVIESKGLFSIIVMIEKTNDHCYDRFCSDRSKC